MSVLRLLILCLTGSLIVGLGSLGVEKLGEVRAYQQAEREATRLLQAIQSCIALGSKQEVRISIPLDLMLVENKILIENRLFEEIQLPFTHELYLESGSYRLVVRLENQRISVEKCSSSS